MIDLNPLDVLNKRKVEHIVPHFSKTKVQEFHFNNEIEDWIKNKLKGRYFYTRALDAEDTKLKNVSAIGFENHSEMTYFLLACPFIRRNI